MTEMHEVPVAGAPPLVGRVLAPGGYEYTLCELDRSQAKRREQHCFCASRDLCAVDVKCARQVALPHAIEQLIATLSLWSGLECVDYNKREGQGRIKRVLSRARVVARRAAPGFDSRRTSGWISS